MAIHDDHYETENTGHRHYAHASMPAQLNDLGMHYLARNRIASSDSDPSTRRNDDVPTPSAAIAKPIQIQVRKKRSFTDVGKADAEEVPPPLPIEEAVSPTAERPIKAPVPIVILRCKQVQIRTGFSRSAIYDKLDKKSTRHDPTFPRQIKIGLHSVGWIEQEISDFLEARFKASRELAPMATA